jgi:hypothetical protein
MNLSLAYELRVPRPVRRVSAFGMMAAVAVLSGCAGVSGVSPTSPTVVSSAQGISRQPLALSSQVGAPANKGSCTGQNLIQDGDFETPVVPMGGYTGFDSGSALGPWTVIGPYGDGVALLSSSLSEDGYTYNAQSGVQSLDLTVPPNGPAGVQQTVYLEANHAYNLCFWVGNIHDPKTIFGRRSTVIVMVNGQQILEAKNARGTAGSGVVVWKQFKTTFSVPGGATTISFNNGDPVNDNYNGLDSVELVF